MNHLILAFKAYQSDVDIHKHSAYQMVLSTDNPFSTHCNGKTYNKVFGFVIKPQVPHACASPHSNVLVINIEPFSPAGKYLSVKLKEIENPIIFYTKAQINHYFGVSGKQVNPKDILNKLSSQLPLTSTDQRITKIISHIQQNHQSSKFSLHQISNLVFLSPSRLGFLFKQHTGSSISKYLLWTRLKNAIHLILSKKTKTLTQIAHESGFYDSSQMTKYMYQMFGLSPSRLKQKSDLIQLLDEYSH
ncbi:MAG: AraC family transcriptional regulator [Bacteroidia bacterium]|nr:AraC family transcriptional regulator [Bacteroidia bacterium]